MIAIRFKDPANVPSFIDRFRNYTLPSGTRVYAEYPRQGSRHASSTSRTPRQDSHYSTSTMSTPTPATATETTTFAAATTATTTATASATASAPISTNTSTVSHQSSQPTPVADETHSSFSQENDASLTWPME